MSPIALIMMVVALIIVWGGLVAAIVNIRLRPEVDPNLLPPEPEELVADDLQREHDAPLRRDT
ncbi:methionine/alanine import family NSS transporter small subunit [Granulicoccus sp. GXG6511]|uniref:methionine/alanine import family NSS transporter small subunit n=1 Tax=Granulicoccus sp. GXG6511 TaxID=3381351 RepID=UPI003D7E0096